MSLQYSQKHDHGRRGSHGYAPGKNTFSDVPVMIVLAITISIAFAGTCYSAEKQMGTAPITPRQWTEAGGIGAWMIFDWADTGRGVKVTRQAFASMKSIGITCGRLHMADSKNVCIEPGTHRLKDSVLQRIGDCIDFATEQNMAVMLQFGFDDRENRAKVMGKDLAARKEGITSIWNKYITVWEQCSVAFKDKSYLFAMAPFIECHSFDGVFDDRNKGPGAYSLLIKDFPWIEGAKDKLELLLRFNHLLTRIYRKHNPKRIMGYKGMGRGAPPIGVKNLYLKSLGRPLLTTKKGQPEFPLTFPFGDDPDTTYQMAIMPMSHTERQYWDWDINKERTNEEILEDARFLPRAVALWSKESGISVFNDHGFWVHGKEGRTKLSVKRPPGSGPITLHQAYIGLRDALIFAERSNIPYAAIQINSFLTPDGKLEPEKLDISDLTRQKVPTEGLTGKELKRAESVNKKLQNEIENRRLRHINSQAIIKAYRDAAAITAGSSN
jgi:hypothetical protein